MRHISKGTVCWSICPKQRLCHHTRHPRHLLWNDKHAAHRQVQSMVIFDTTASRRQIPTHGNMWYRHASPSQYLYGSSSLARHRDICPNAHTQESQFTLATLLGFLAGETHSFYSTHVQQKRQVYVARRSCAVVRT